MNKATLEIVREFDAPRELVWKAWTNEEMMKKWWGPKIFSCPVAKIDLKVGGKYHFCMRDLDGKDYWSTGIYKEIIVNEKLLCTDSFADAEGNVVGADYYGMPNAKDFPLEFEINIVFEELPGNRTKMTLKHEGHPAGQIFEMATQGWSESFDKLVTVLE